MNWNKENLDLFLVPGGLFIMFVYHLYLLYRYLFYPESTVLGFENHCLRSWVKKLMQVDAVSRGPAFTVISCTISAATYMASLSLALSSLIGTWLGSTSGNQIVNRFIYGDTEVAVASMKHIGILFFFMLSFVCFVQCSRCYIHANLLLSMPSTEVPEAFVIEALIDGANFWQVGLRGIYFAVTLIMWVFGPIPMFASSIGMVTITYFLDVNRKPLHHFHGQSEKRTTYS